MIIDCERCVMRDLACDDCVVTALLGSPHDGVTCTDGVGRGYDAGIDLTPDERDALDVLAAAGLTRRLRLHPAVSREPAGGSVERAASAEGRRAG